MRDEESVVDGQLDVELAYEVVMRASPQLTNLESAIRQLRPSILVSVVVVHVQGPDGCSLLRSPD